MRDHHPPELQGTILVVDDNPSDLHLLVAILAKNGYDVRPHSDGAAALAAARTNPPALIVLDVDMPQLDGYEVCRQLKTEEGTADVPVIFTSASNKGFDRARLFAAGGVDCITKPFQAAEVLTIVETHLSLYTMRQCLQDQKALWQQEKSKRKQTEAELQRLRERLEELVEARTADLKATNEKLRQEIAERRQAEESLRLTRFTVEHISDALHWVGPNGRIVDVNEAACRMLGYTRQELTQMSVHDIDPAPPYRVEPGFAQRLRQTRTATFETEHRTKDGRLVPVEIVANMIEFGDQEFNCCFVRDITERKQVEAALQESEEKYRSLVETARDPIFTCDEDGRYLFVNTAAAAVFGMTPAEMVGESVHDLFPAHIADENLVSIRQVIQSGKGMISEAMSEINGQPYWFSTNMQPIHDQEGNVKTVQAVVRDISDLKRAELALRESEERLRQAVRASRIGIYDHNHLTDTIYWSLEQRQNYGWGPEEEPALSKFLAQVHPEDRERIGEAVRRAHDPADDGLFDVEHRIIRRDGAVRWLSTRSQTFFEGEGDARHPVRTVGAVLDVTESRLAEEAQAKLEEQLRQAQKMESIGRLAGGIAHDFNNLLVPIISYAELGQVQLSPDSKLYAVFGKISTAADRAAALTRQLLAFSRRQVLEVQVLNLNEVVVEFREMLRRLITEDIELQIVLAPTPCMVEADRTQIEQLLLNLSVNASDAMPTGGNLIIETDNVCLDEAYAQAHPETEPGHYVMLSLSDTGHGMDAETQSHIFEPFFTTKEQGKGTGLGLATVFGIVKQHQGHIWLYSEPGKGTTFKVYLPRSEETTQLAVTAVPEPESVYGTETVMVVEDAPLVRKLTCETLAAHGYTVIEAESPEKGLQSAFSYEGTIHLLLTDVIMPGMNGRELYERLAAVRPDLKVLYMSGYTDDVIVHHGVLDEGINFIQKPFTVRGLTQKVRRVLDRESSSGSQASDSPV